MSKIFFHSPSGDVEVSGSERAYMGLICGNFLMTAIGPITEYRNYPHWIRKLLPPSSWINTTDDFERSIGLFLRAQDEDEGLLYHGELIPTFHLALNSALFAGKDPVKLMARLHAQCEIHCYVAPENHHWLAGIIREGRKYNVMREGEGWESVIEMLYEGPLDEPVVCSYSVTDQFPSLRMTPNDHPWHLSRDAWWNASTSEQWSVCWQYLYQSRPDLELTPKTWDNYYFGNGVSGFDLRELADEKYPGSSLNDLYEKRWIELHKRITAESLPERI